MTKIHDRTYFYKYVTAEAALLILQNRKLKYSSPFIFNDPFDVQTRIFFAFSESELVELLIKEWYRLVYNARDHQLDPGAPLSPHVTIMRELARHTSRKASLETWMKEIKEIGIKQYQEFLGTLNNWWVRIGKASHIFCVVEEPDNLLMWAHYAQNHQGAVIDGEIGR